MLFIKGINKTQPYFNQAYLELVHFAGFLSLSQFPGRKKISEHHFCYQSTLNLLFGV